ncbi:MAG: GIY-YIG nuclease family protein [Candidatus Moranbacteria bacterium]|nr:GIY-YIG nuclease family protein [Candidatus Moranbacteria bacterium]
MVKKGFVYILFSKKDKKTYTGSTDDLRKRLEEHERGLCKSTRNRRPLRLIHTESYDNLSQAHKREKYLKTAIGRKEIKKIFENHWGVAKR